MAFASASERRGAGPALLAALLTVSACGADGPPIPPPRSETPRPIEAPAEDDPESGIVLTGSGYMGAMRRF